MAEMLKSFDKTKSEGTDMVIYVADNDTRIDEYKVVLSGRNVIYGPDRGCLVEVLNYLVLLYPDYEYYSEVNDDHVYITKGWDEKLMKAIEDKGGWGVACGNDLVTKDWYHMRHPSATMISGKIIRALGYFTWPKLKHFASDDYHRDLGEGINALIHLPEVIIEHRCWHAAGKAENDEVYEAVYSDEAFNYGNDVYRDWKNGPGVNEINRLKEVMKEDGVGQ